MFTVIINMNTLTNTCIIIIAIASTITITISFTINVAIASIQKLYALKAIGCRETLQSTGGYIGGYAKDIGGPNKYKKGPRGVTQGSKKRHLGVGQKKKGQNKDTGGRKKRHALLPITILLRLLRVLLR